MFELSINANSGSSHVIAGESYLNIKKYLPEGKKVFVITDSNVYNHYIEFFNGYEALTVTAGEASKSIDVICSVYRYLIEHEADRDMFVLGVGGGVVCDITGFVASTYMRGLKFGFISTSLLSQVDASVGGKNGINMQGYKNMVGTFTQPQFVLCDTKMLATLPQREYISGLAEVVKMAAIKNMTLFAYIEQNIDAIKARDPETVEHLVIESIKIKASIIESDEREQGERRILNFGHTVGHAVEQLKGVSHGDAVSIGIIAALSLSISECGLLPSEALRLADLLSHLGLPVSAKITGKDIIDCMLRDKKREQDTINLVLLKKIGEPVILKMSVEKVSDKLNHLYQ